MATLILVFLFLLSNEGGTISLRQKRILKKTREYVTTIAAQRDTSALFEGVCSIPGGSKYEEFRGAKVDLSGCSKDVRDFLKHTKFRHVPEQKSDAIKLLDAVIEVAERRERELLTKHSSNHPEIIYRNLKLFQQTIPERIESEDEKSIFRKRLTPPKIPHIMHDAVKKTLEDSKIDSWTSSDPAIRAAFYENLEYFTVESATIKGRELAFSRMDKAIVDLRNRLTGSTRSQRRINSSSSMKVEGPEYIGRGETKIFRDGR